jgi:serine phosphatase RsbU (regulator of sigma subunit)/AAA+ ATPase superfamily predicted ATPase
MKGELTAGIVRVLGLKGETAGTGFVVAEDGLIATCAHVVDGAGAGPGDVVNVVLYANGGNVEAEVESAYWRDPDAEDVAILRPKGSLPDKVMAQLLGSSLGSEYHPFRTFGFPGTKPVEGMVGVGIITGRTTENGFPVLQLRSTEVTLGFSGAPALDTNKSRVVGMVVSIAEPDASLRGTETSFIIPTETLKRVCAALTLSEVAPYRGLDTFFEEDAKFFYGRKRVVDRLLKKLRGEPSFLAVLGPSGSGKSSVIQAGLMPQLRRGQLVGSDRWEVIVNRRYDDPFERLVEQGFEGAREGLSNAATAWLGRHPEQKRLVLVMDQFEQLFVECPGRLRKRFFHHLDNLLAASADLITVIVVMRDDFYPQLAQQAPTLWEREWLPEHSVQIPGEVNSDELFAIVQEPAKAVGLRFQNGLISDIVDDALDTAALGETEDRVARTTILPLLEFALAQLWESRQEGELTHEAYKRIGGVTGGLERWANKAYRSLSEELQLVAQRILADLVRLGDESEGIPNSRRRKSLDELCRNTRQREMVQQVVRQLTDARLLVTAGDLSSGQTTVQIIHEALLSEWDLLRRWLRENRHFLTWRDEIERRTRAWIQTSPQDTEERDSGRLLRGRDLAEAQDWLGAFSEDVGEAERMFIEASQEQERREQEERQLSEYIGQELRVANTIQKTLLPKSLPELTGYEVATYYQPAWEVGGDFYDFFELEDGRVGVAVGDAAGKGMPAAIAESATSSMLRAVAQASDYSPREVLARVNETLAPRIPPNMFVTCFYAILDHENASLSYANAGHDLPYLWHGGHCEELRARGMPLGLMPGMSYEEEGEVSLREGDSVLFYSDGLVEAHDPKGELFGHLRLEKLVAEHGGKTSLVDLLLEELYSFTGEGWVQEDDITLVTLQRSRRNKLRRLLASYTPS